MAQLTVMISGGFSGPYQKMLPIANKFAKAVSEAMNTPEVKERMSAQSLEISNKGPEAMAAFMKAEITRFKTLNKRLNIQLE